VQSSSQIITTNKPTPNPFYRPDALPVAQPTVSKHRREMTYYICYCYKKILTKRSTEHKSIIEFLIYLIQTVSQVRNKSSYLLVIEHIMNVISCIQFETLLSL